MQTLHRNFTCCLCLAALVLLCSCGESPLAGKVQGNFYTPRYANGFCIDTCGGAKVLTVVNPFQQAQKICYRYPIGATPPQRVICMSTTHVAFLSFIDKTSGLVGVSGAGNLYDSTMQAAYVANRIADVGYDKSLNMEKMLELQPDVIFTYGVSGEFLSTAEKLEELGLRVVYIGEYTEQHPLGKAEWAVAFAAFWGCEAEVVDKFAQVEATYLSLKDLAATSPEKVKVLLNAPWGDAWFVPGAYGNAATLLEDAQGESAIPLRRHRDSYPISIETAYSHAQSADIWLNTGQASSLSELRVMHKLIENIPAFRCGKAYNCNARTSPQGGNDFFESGTVNPHLILKDVVKLLHPDLLPDYTLTYYRQLQ
ncbi:MAG: ABC transporter substrate-binding protein [Prevotellaceae bacterium]|jgi:iron complex transport system substrate-binding protein|nr:ABC transporter substrate-binding protein [Prevotellaceae bacterium]